MSPQLNYTPIDIPGTHIFSFGHKVLLGTTVSILFGTAIASTFAIRQYVQSFDTNTKILVQQHVRAQEKVDPMNVKSPAPQPTPTIANTAFIIEEPTPIQDSPSIPESLEQANNNEIIEEIQETGISVSEEPNYQDVVFAGEIVSKTISVTNAEQVVVSISSSDPGLTLSLTRPDGVVIDTNYAETNPLEAIFTYNSDESLYRSTAVSVFLPLLGTWTVHLNGQNLEGEVAHYVLFVAQ